MKSTGFENKFQLKSSLLKLFIALLLSVLGKSAHAQVVTTQYQGFQYQSNQPHNLNVYYFKASDIPLDTSYLRRHSQILLWLQQYYRQQMQNNGYGNKTFGLWTSASSGDTVRIILVNGRKPINSYRSSTPGGNDSLIQEFRDFETAHPQYKLSEHNLILVATPGVSQMNGLPYYGIGKTCLATDYPELDLQYMGQTGTIAQQFVTYFGGIAHELGHALNLPHSHQTLSENQNPSQGTNLMADGNYTLTASPTFINRAGAAILNRCQLFNTQPAASFYTGHIAGLLSVHSQFSAGVWTISGRFQSNVPVTDINVYQDPFQNPSAGYQRVAFSVAPLGTSNDSFRVVMPVTEVMQGANQYPPTGPWNLAIELVLENGETEERWFPFRYNNRTPSSGFTFDDLNCGSIPPGFSLTQIGSAFSPGQACFRPIDSSVVMRVWATGPGGVKDNFPFLWRPFLSGDTLSMRVLSVSDTWNDQVGLMVRASLDSNSAYAAISALDYRGVFWSWRSQTGQQSGYNLVNTLALPFWIKVTRSTNWVEGFYSSDGQNWTLYYRRNLPLPNQAVAGVFIGKNGARGVVDQIRHNGLTVGTIEKEIEAGVQVFPNPFLNEIKIRSLDEQNPVIEVRILDLRGTCLHRERFLNSESTRKCNPAGLPSGLYLIESTLANGERTIQKLMRQ